MRKANKCLRLLFEAVMQCVVLTVGVLAGYLLIAGALVIQIHKTMRGIKYRKPKRREPLYTQFVHRYPKYKSAGNESVFD